MLLLVLIMFISGLNFTSDPFSSSVVVVHHDQMAARAHSLSEDELCDAALQTFMKRADSDLARHIKPHLVSAIKDAASSPESDSDDNSPSPKRIMRTWARQPESVRTTPRPELDEVILSAVQKAFDEKEAVLKKKEQKIENMFSKKTTAIITTVVGAIVTIASTLASVYGTMGNVGNSGNCTK